MDSSDFLAARVKRIVRLCRCSGGGAPYLVLVLLCGFSFLPLFCDAVQREAPSNPAEDAYRQGMTLLQEGRVDAALKVFEKGLVSNPTNKVLLNAAGAAYMLSGNETKAEELLLKVLAIDPGFLPAKKNLAIAYFNAGKYEVARPQFEELARNPQAAPTAYLFLGLDAEKNQQYEKALLLFEKSSGLADHEPQALRALAHALYELRKPEEAERALQGLERIPKVSAADYLQVGHLCLQHGRYPQALEYFEKARRLDHDLPGVDYYRARALDEMGKAQQALQVLRDLDSRRPDAVTLNLLGRVASETGDTELAIQSYRKAAEVKPDMEENYLDYSALCMNSENYVLALEILDVGLTHLPRSYRLLVQKGAVLDKLTRRREAEEVFRSAVKLQPDNSVAVLSLAIAQAHDHRLDEAAETLSAAIRRFPEDAYMTYFYGSVLVQLAEKQGMRADIVGEAKNCLNRALQLNPSFADSHYQLAKLYIVTDPLKASEQLEACLRLKPDHYSAELQLGRLYQRIGRHAEGERLISQAMKDKQAEKEREERTPRIERANSTLDRIAVPD